MKHQLTREEKGILGDVFTGALIGGIIDPLLGYLVLKNPEFIVPTFEPYFYTPDLIHFALDGSITALGYFTGKGKVMWVGIGMLSAKIAQKLTIWIWGVLRPGYPIWGAPQTSPGLSHRAPSPYVTQAERLPFQTDIGY